MVAAWAAGAASVACGGGRAAIRCPTTSRSLLPAPAQQLGRQLVARIGGDDAGQGGQLQGVQVLHEPGFEGRAGGRPEVARERRWLPSPDHEAAGRLRPVRLRMGRGTGPGAWPGRFAGGLGATVADGDAQRLAEAGRKSSGALIVARL